jgi:hypothetical protein
MITQNEIIFNFNHIFTTDQPFVKICNQFTYLAEKKKEMLLKIPGTNQFITCNSKSIKPESESDLNIYKIQLTENQNIISAECNCPLKLRKNSNSMFDTIYTYYYDFSFFRKQILAESLVNHLKFTATCKIPFYIKLFKGSCKFIIGSKVKDEERGVLHKTQTHQRKKFFFTKLSFDQFLPDQLAITVGLSGNL